MEYEDSIKIRFNSQSCVRFNKPFAQCQSCVDVCSEGALNIEQYTVSFDSERCTACGLCTAACLEEAFQTTKQDLASESDGMKVVYFACAHAKSSHTRQRQSAKCIAALSLSRLSELYLQGVRSYFVLTGDCASCSYNIHGDVLERFKQFNRYLSELELPNVDCRFLNDAGYSLLDIKFANNTTEVLNGRRGSIRRAIRRVSERTEQAIESKKLESTSPLLQSLRTLATISPNKDSSLFSVSVDANDCNFCADCTKVCPHDALKFQNDSGKLYFSIDSRLCTACRVCEDICLKGAVSVDENLSGRNHQIALQSENCKSCGVTFYQKYATDDGQNQCDICRAKKASQDQKLFQVY